MSALPPLSLTACAAAAMAVARLLGGATAAWDCEAVRGGVLRIACVEVVVEVTGAGDGAGTAATGFC